MIRQYGDTCGIRNPVNEAQRIWNLQSTAWNPESKTVLDHFTWGDCFSTSGGSRGRIQGEVPGGPGPPISDLTLVWDWNSHINRIVYHFLTGWAFYSRNIQKCNCFWVPSYDLFASARKAVFPSPAATGVHRLRKRWLSLWEVIFHKKVQQSFLNQSLDPLIKNSWIRPCVIENSRISWNPFCAIPVLAL